MNEPFRVDFSQGAFSVEMPTLVFWSIVVLLIAFNFRRRSLSDRGKWDSAWNPIPPSLKENPAPMVTAWRAMSSLFSSFGFGLLWILALAVAVDLAFLQGEASIYVWENLGPGLAAASRFFRDILRQIVATLV
ncbi:hypothetical protein GC175_25360 [bacterium]|nr:hypothetical protein [bacterium]